MSPIPQMVPEPDGKGDCFLAALYSATEADSRGGITLIVHGLPTGNGGDVLGIQHWHAWVEVKTSDVGWVAVDVSNGKKIVTPRQRFYRAGRLTERLVWRYTLDDAERNIRRHGTAGPWVKGWETMGEASR